MRKAAAPPSRPRPRRGCRDHLNRSRPGNPTWPRCGHRPAPSARSPSPMGMTERILKLRLCPVCRQRAESAARGPAAGLYTVCMIVDGVEVSKLMGTVPRTWLIETVQVLVTNPCWTGSTFAGHHRTVDHGQRREGRGLSTRMASPHRESGVGHCPGQDLVGRLVHGIRKPRRRMPTVEVRRPAPPPVDTPRPAAAASRRRQPRTRPAAPPTDPTVRSGPWSMRARSVVAAAVIRAALVGLATTWRPGSRRP